MYHQKFQKKKIVFSSHFEGHGRKDQQLEPDPDPEPDPDLLITYSDPYQHVTDPEHCQLGL
jgi:hypothetical protein